MAADPISTTKPDEIEALFVQTAHSMSYDDGVLTLHGLTPTALFIDIIGRPLSPVSVAGVHRRAGCCAGRF